MNFTPPSEPYRRRTCARLERFALICLIPLISLAQEAPSGTPAGIPPAEPSRQCGPRALGLCAEDLARDQVHILTSPLRVRKKDLRWLVPFAAATATAFAFDRRTLDLVSTNTARVDAYRSVSNYTGIYAPLAGIGARGLTGVIKHDDYVRETGYWAGEAMADTALFTTMFKYAANRVRPQSAGLSGTSGKFWPDDKSYPGGDSVPSGHSAAAFAFAHVMASRYPGWKTKLAVYGLAAATAFERVAGREHFPSDVLAGGAIGYLIGGYVVHVHHAGPSRNQIMVSPLVGGNGLGVSLVFSRSNRTEANEAGSGY